MDRYEIFNKFKIKCKSCEEKDCDDFYICYSLNLENQLLTALEKNRQYEDLILSNISVKS
jgi:hypothetical protein